MGFGKQCVAAPDHMEYNRSIIVPYDQDKGGIRRWSWLQRGMKTGEEVFEDKPEKYYGNGSMKPGISSCFM